MNHSRFALDGRTALITGSTRGIGRALAIGLGEAGARILVNGRSASTVAATIQDLHALQVQAEPLPFDVTDAPAALAAIRAAGQIDILVNNAGMQKRGQFVDYEETDFQRVLDTNLTSAFRLSQAVAPGMIARRAGKIVNIASLTSRFARAGSMAYATAKGGLQMLTRALAAELAPHNVQANAIAPGFFRTELNSVMVNDPVFTEWLEKRTPAMRWGEVEELVGAAIFLSSDASSFVNGETLAVDGGFSAVM